MYVRKQGGFGLVEIMVGLLIGMFGVVVMMQTFSMSEANKRTTTSGGDALNEGAISLYTTQTDLRMAGFGFTDPRIMGCSLTLRSGVSVTAAPVVINPAGITGNDAGTDSFVVMYGNGNGSPQGDAIIGTGGVVQTPSGFAAKDQIIVTADVRPAPCSLTLDEVASVSGAALATKSGGALPATGMVFNMGQSLRVVGYAIRGGNLTMCDYMNAAQDCTKASGWRAVGANVVSMRAQYGRDTSAAGAMDGAVDIYDKTTPDTSVTPNTSCNWARISSIRFALVVRSNQYEKEVVTGVAPTWDGSLADNPSGSAASPVDLTGLKDWKNYRYKVFQTTTPLRNVSWLGVPSGC